MKGTLHRILGIPAEEGETAGRNFDTMLRISVHFRGHINFCDSH
jgi:hypothetical protein